MTKLLNFSTKPEPTNLHSRLVKYVIFVMLGLMIITVFVPIVFFNTNTFIGLIPLYTLVFLGIISYAIVKHQLFEIKAFATEPLIIGLWLLLVILTILSKTVDESLIPILILVAVVLFGTLLLWSARREASQREQLQQLTDKMAQANARLQTLDQSRSEFISIASHQLRTPSAIIKWYLAAILAGDYGLLNPQVKDALKKTAITTNELIALTDELLNVSRIERGKMEFFYEQTQIQELVEKAVEQFTPLASIKKLALSFKKPSKPLPVIMADRERIREVINNLVDNAIKYTRQGTVTVETSSDNKNLTIRVSDTGKGVGPEEAKIIFQKYSQGKDPLLPVTGLGLGLYLAQIIIKQHKGEIWCESQGVSKGSTFIFTLPIKNGLKTPNATGLA